MLYEGSKILFLAVVCLNAQFGRQSATPIKAISNSKLLVSILIRL